MHSLEGKFQDFSREMNVKLTVKKLKAKKFIPISFLFSPLSVCSFSFILVSFFLSFLFTLLSFYSSWYSSAHFHKLNIRCNHNNTFIHTSVHRLHRLPKHLLDFLLAELGTSGSVDGNHQLIIKGRFQQKQIENVLRRYIKEYVTCHTCRSPETILQKDTRLFFLQCETCGSRCSVASIKSGFQVRHPPFSRNLRNLRFISIFNVIKSGIPMIKLYIRLKIKR